MEQKRVVDTNTPDQAVAPPSKPPGRNRLGRLKTFSSLQKNRDYRFLFAGNLCSNAALWLQIFTVGWLVLNLSGGSAVQSGTAVAIRTLPGLLVGPWAGTIVDRWDRRKTALVVQVWMAVAALGFALLVAAGQVKVWHAYIFMMVSGMGFTIIQTARLALIGNTVPREDLTNALVLHSMTGNSMRIIGPLTGGILIETVGFKWSFIAQAGLNIGMLLLLLPMRTPYREGAANLKDSMWSNMAEGVRYMFQHRVIFQLNVLNITRSAVFQTLILMMPAYTEEALHAGPGTGTVLITAMAVGGLVSSLVISSWQFFTKRGITSLASLATGAICVMLLGQSQWLWLSIPAIALLGFFQTTFVTSSFTALQDVVPDNFRGRIFSVWQYLDVLVLMWVFFLGLAVELTSIGIALTGLGAITLSLAGAFTLRFKEIRELS